MHEELKRLLEAQGQAFEDFKAANDERLQALAKGKAVSELEAKTDKINDELTRLGKELKELAKRANRPGGPGDEADALNEEHKAAFDDYLRKEKTDGLHDLQVKAVQVGDPPSGGYAVPTRLDRSILQLLRDESPMRQVCRVMTIGGENYERLVNLGTAASGWVGETDPRPETSTPKLAKITPVIGEIYANPAATQRVIDDAFFDVAGWLAEEVAFEFAKQENLAFLYGDGENKPQGLMTHPMSNAKDDARPFGTLQTIPTGNPNGWPTMENGGQSTEDGDVLLDLIYGLKKGYRAGAYFMMNTLTLATIRKWKALDGHYLWQPSVQAGQPSLIFGFPIVENHDLPDVGPGSIPIIFGNLRRTYTIVDRFGIRVLRDPFTNKPFVHFYTTKRVGGLLEDTQAIKLLKCAAHETVGP